MKLADLESYNPITIQCHDNPDADTIASGFALYEYFKHKGKQVELIYSGKFSIQKNNLLLMVEKLAIPIVYKKVPEKIHGLLLTVDCQYGAGNVYRIPAEMTAVIDHHQVEIAENEMCEIRSSLGSCSTLVWHLLEDAGCDVNADNRVGTALYYGLYTDTNQFAELSNPLDMDMRERVTVNKSLITLFRNSNISLKELETAGIALIRNIYNEEYRYSIIKAEPCDPNILGLISDFLLQVAGVDTCVVYNELPGGFKISVRSCIKEVHADELAIYLCDGVGSGGGHLEKAGGFISRGLYNATYMGIHSEAYFSDRLTSYFENTQIIYAKDVTIDTRDCKRYQKKNMKIGFVNAIDVYPIGTAITVRTLEGDMDLTVTEDLVIMIGVKGEVYPTNREKFRKSYQVLPGKYNPYESVIKAEYIPMIKNRLDGTIRKITELAGNCISTGNVQIYAKPLEMITKVFARWDEEKYLLGKPGDFLAVRSDDAHDIYVVEKEIFGLTYDEVS